MLDGDDPNPFEDCGCLGHALPLSVRDLDSLYNILVLDYAAPEIPIQELNTLGSYTGMNAGSICSILTGSTRLAIASDIP